MVAFGLPGPVTKFCVCDNGADDCAREFLGEPRSNGRFKMQGNARCIHTPERMIVGLRVLVEVMFVNCVEHYFAARMASLPRCPRIVDG